MSAESDVSHTGFGLHCGERSRVLVVDLQTGLLPHITDGEAIEAATGFLIDAAGIFDIPVLATEQYPKGLGATVPSIADRLGNPAPEKLRFSAVEVLPRQPEQSAVSHAVDTRDQLVVVGIETHVCVLQTCLEAVAAGYLVTVAVDAVGSRHPLDHETALQRLRDTGVTLSTVESIAFEWCGVAGNERFRKLSRLIRERDQRRRGNLPS